MWYFLFACTSENSPWSYLEEGQYILENSQANIVKKFDIPMEEDGIVGPPNGSKPREVLIKDLSA
mgnify:CR=1 FL=1